MPSVYNPLQVSECPSKASMNHFFLFLKTQRLQRTILRPAEGWIWIIRLEEASIPANQLQGIKTLTYLKAQVGPKGNCKHDPILIYSEIGFYSVAQLSLIRITVRITQNCTELQSETTTDYRCISDPLPLFQRLTHCCKITNHFPK